MYQNKITPTLEALDNYSNNFMISSQAFTTYIYYNEADMRSGKIGAIVS